MTAHASYAFLCSSRTDSKGEMRSDIALRMGTPFMKLLRVSPKKAEPVAEKHVSTRLVGMCFPAKQ